MASYWDHSWECIDLERVFRYVNQFDMKTDEIIEYLQSKQVHTVCDAGCGCGIYTLKLLYHGFDVSGFDVADGAVEIARQQLAKASYKAVLKTASVLATGYADGQFDAVVSRDVIDHLSKKDALLAIKELYRITKPGGIVYITLDHVDSEYEQEPHMINDDGDFVFSDGKWQGMIFHPYDEQEIKEMIPAGATCEVKDTDEIVVKIIKT